jgi:hypothetical protein
MSSFQNRTPPLIAVAAALTVSATLRGERSGHSGVTLDAASFSTERSMLDRVSQPQPAGAGSPQQEGSSEVSLDGLRTKISLPLKNGGTNGEKENWFLPSRIEIRRLSESEILAMQFGVRERPEAAVNSPQRDSHPKPLERSSPPRYDIERYDAERYDVERTQPLSDREASRLSQTPQAASRVNERAQLVILPGVVAAGAYLVFALGQLLRSGRSEPGL